MVGKAILPALETRDPIGGMPGHTPDARFDLKLRVANPWRLSPMDLHASNKVSERYRGNMPVYFTKYLGAPAQMSAQSKRIMSRRIPPGLTGMGG